MARLTLALCCFLLGVVVWAHEDPSGDVHPTITVERGNFVVWFYNNRAKSDRYFNRIISPTGAVLATREPVPELSSNARDRAGLRVNPIQDRELPWKWKESQGDSGGYLEEDGRLLFHFSGKAGEGDPFYLGSYDVALRKLTSSGRVGVPARIYNFAVASRVVRVGEVAYIAWIEERNKRQNERF